LKSFESFSNVGRVSSKIEVKSFAALVFIRSA
jgi:hypothetical protein